MKRIISIILITSFMLTGCKAIFTPNAYTNIEMMSDVKYMEIRQLQYESKLEKERDTKPQILNLYEVKDADTRDKLYMNTFNIIDNINRIYGYECLDSEHDYFKLNIDPWVIDKDNISFRFMKNQSNYYVFCDVKDAILNKDVSTFKKTANYMGINGAFNYNEFGEIIVDTVYLTTLIKTINAYREMNNLDLLDEKVEDISFIPDYDEEIYQASYLDLLEVATNSEIVEDLSEQYELDVNREEDILKDLETPEEEGRKIRRLAYNAEEFNNVVGISRDYYQIIPPIAAIFNILPSKSICGDAIYKFGETFKEITDKTRGSGSIVFVYSKGKNQEGEITYDFNSLFFDNWKVNFKVEPNSTVEYIDSFIKTQCEIVVEDFSRALSNKDPVRLTSKELLYPSDLGLYMLYLRNCVDIVNNVIWIDKYIRTEQNTHVLLLNQIVEECPKGVQQIPGRYLKKWLARLEVKDGSMCITDIFPYSLQALRYPIFDTMNGKEEKLFILENLDRSNVSDDLKREINEELQKIALALNNKALTDKYEGNKIVRYGIRDRFSSDTLLMTEKDLTNLLQTMSNKLIKYGNKTECQVFVIPSLWINASEDNSQVSLTINILFKYAKDKADVWNCYIVYDKFKDVWKMDQFIIEQEVSYNDENAVKKLEERYQVTSGEKSNNNEKK